MANYKIHACRIRRQKQKQTHLEAPHYDIISEVTLRAEKSPYMENLKSIFTFEKQKYLVRAALYVTGMRTAMEILDKRLGKADSSLLDKNYQKNCLFICLY